MQRLGVPGERQHQDSLQPGQAQEAQVSHDDPTLLKKVIKNVSFYTIFRIMLKGTVARELFLN